MKSAATEVGSFLIRGPVDAGGDEGMWSVSGFGVRTEADHTTRAEAGADDGVSASHGFSRGAVIGDFGFERSEDLVAGEVGLIVRDE